ncbi:MAG: hypothetical protein WBD73_16905 [Candidatus Acidiferrales bacterium]
MAACRPAGRVAVNHHEMPKFGLVRTARQREAQPQNAVREDRMVGKLHPARAQRSEPALGLGHGRLVVVLEQLHRLLCQPVDVAWRIVVGVAEGDRMPIDEGVLAGAGELGLVRQRRAAEKARLHPGAGKMAGRHVIVVGAIVDQGLPVDRLQPFDRSERLRAAVTPVEYGIEIPAGVAEIGLEARRVPVPGREDDAGIGLDAGRDEAERGLVERAVIGFALARNVLQRTVVAVGPAVIGAHEPLGVAVVDATHAVAAVAAHIEQRVEPSLPVAGQDDRVLAHIRVKEIVGRGDQALVADHQPGTPENLLHLVVINRLVAEDAAVELAAGGIDDGVFRKRTHQPRALCPAVMIQQSGTLFTGVRAAGNPR